MKMRTLFLFAALLGHPLTAGAVEVSFEKDSSLPVVYLNIAVRAGTVTDPDGQSGITNFMGEMLLRGTRSRTKEQLDRDLDQIGAQLGVETRAEAMVVRGAVLASQLDKFLRIVTEVLTQPRFADAEMRKLKALIVSGLLEELSSDQSLASRRFAPFLFRGHPYGKPIMGRTVEIQKLTIEQVRAHYERIVRDRLLLVAGAGDAPVGTIQAWAQGLAAQRSGGEAPTIVAAPSDASERRLLLIDKPDRTQTQINVGHVGMRMTHPNYFPMYVANQAFGGGSFQSRLMTEVRSKRGWSYGASSGFRHGLQPRSWIYYLFPATKDTVAALELTLKMVEEWREKGLDVQEFEFSKQRLINSSAFMSDTPRKRVENLLLERTLDLPEGYMRNYGPRIAEVTLEQANAAIKEHIHPDRLAISVLCTAKDLKEALAKVAGVGPKQVSVVPYTQD